MHTTKEPPMTIDWSSVERIARSAERDGGTVGVSIIAPGGERFAYGGDRTIPAASTVKIPIMVEIYRQVERGERSLDDLFTLRDEDKTPGSGVLLHIHDGVQLALNDLIYLMISISDNTATNLLIDMAGMEQVNATMRSLGMKDSVLGRKMRGRPAIEGEQENWATADDYARAVQSILNREAASVESCERMEAMLEKQQNPRRLARYLPKLDGLRWGSKTGTITGVCNEAGFITTPAGTLIISVLTQGLVDAHTAEQVIGDVARAAWQASGILESARIA
jgi:beta-lactamase class A